MFPALFFFFTFMKETKCRANFYNYISDMSIFSNDQRRKLCFKRNKVSSGLKVKKRKMDVSQEENLIHREQNGWLT